MAVSAIQNLIISDFYKSMEPSFTSWQDAFKSNFKDVQLYIKFQVNAYGERIRSFKGK